MDVRCEKCQTEYELDESRLKPGGVTVKCTNCGHMFKIRKRTPTNVGLPAVPEQARGTSGSKPPSNDAPTVAGPAPTAAAPNFGDAAAPQRAMSDLGSGPNNERQWLIRLPDGTQKSCRELAILQQWIVAGIVDRDALISRNGKTWKRLGDIPELGQYFVIAEEAKNQRAQKPTPPPPRGAVASTMLGHAGATPGGSPDDDLERRTTGSYKRRPSTTPPPPPPAAAKGTPKINPTAQTELAPTSLASMPATSSAPTPAPARAKNESNPYTAKPIAPPAGERNTSAWNVADIKPSESMAAIPSGPRGGKLSAIPDEPAFAGRVRVQPADESSFRTGKVKMADDDDELMPAHRGSRAGLWIAIMSLLVIAGAATVVYMVAFRDKKQVAQKPPADAAAVAVAPADAAAPVVTPLVDAAPVAPASPLDNARSELQTGVDARVQAALDAIAKQDDPAGQALRARLQLELAQSESDRAGLVDKAEGDKLRKQSKQLVVDAAPLAQRAQKTAPDDASANLAMAEVMRLQGKPARDVQRYLDAAKPKGDDKELARSIALARAELAVRDGKLDDAAKQLGAIDAAGDTRVMFATALVAFVQNRPQDAQPLVAQILVGQPDHDGARALQKKLDTAVAKTDPLPPEDHGKGSATPVTPPPPHNGGGTPPPAGGGGSYDSLLAQANKLAETNCAKAMELYQKALDIKSQGVEALTGMGYCHLDAKQFASAFSNFRAALLVSPKFEPALGGIAETYQRQGNKEQAIESWKHYLEVFPGSPKAKKQLEILGAGEGGAAPPPPPPAPAPAPAPAPVPAPAPAPAPAAGSAM